MLPGRTTVRYLLAIVAFFVLTILSLLVWGLKGRDHFGASVAQGDPFKYRDFAGRSTPEIQDNDLFFHNIGQSISFAKAADITALGPSFVAYALDPALLREFEKKTHRRVYNMSFVGIRGGEFSRQIVTKWQVRPKLWIINADDQFIHFFSRKLDLTIGPETTPIPAAQRNRLQGYRAVVARSLRWRFEDLVAQIRTGDGRPTGLYRNVEHGDLGVDVNPLYEASNNKPIVFDRGRDCHASAETIELAKQFVKDIAGEVVLTLVPHSQYCPAQAREIAAALGVEILIPPDDGYTSIDNGGHLDKLSAERFTDFLTSELVKTAAYRRAFQN